MNGIKNIHLPKKVQPFKQENDMKQKPQTEEVKNQSKEGTCDVDPGYSSMMNLYSEQFNKQLSDIDRH